MGRYSEYPEAQGPRQVRPELQTARIEVPVRGRVEYNADPEQRGRCKIRVYQLHGPQGTDEKTRIKTDDLPWALPCFPVAGVQDFGTFVVPPVGATVWVMFGGGDPEFPLYFGGYFATNAEPEEYLRAMGKPEHEVSMAGAGGVWTSDRGPEAPLEALEMLHATPEVYVPFKSPKGAAVVISDKDERESLAVIDRAGQGLHFESEVQKGPNTGNASRRGSKSVARGGPGISVSGDAVASETRVLLVDAAGQQVSMTSHVGSEKVRVVSRPARGDESCLGGSPEEVAVELDAGHRRVVISTSSSRATRTRIVIDADTGVVEITSPSVLRLDAARVEVVGELSVGGSIVTGGRAVVGGDCLVAGDLVGGTP